ncbi:MAG TPA: hypothetical protein VFD52_00620 [Clostridia bacterium]|nr:hypothetical protein [Clostridia bacterium]
MNKKLISFSFVLLLVLSTFVACKQRSKYGEVFVDNSGEIHILATDENGVTVRTENGNLYEVVTMADGGVFLDSKGEWITEEYEYPKKIHVKEARFRFFPIIFYDNYLQNAALKLMVPKNFEIGDTSSFRIHNEKLECSIECTVNDYGSIEEAQLKAQKTIELLADNDQAEVIEEFVTLCDENTYKCIIINNADKNILTTYYFEKDNYLIRFQTVISKENKDEIDLESILNSAVF